MKQRVADIIFSTLAEMGVRDCFCVVGGGAMHLDNALGVSMDITTHFNHHEQACAMAAETYARYSGEAAVVCVTSGPGATNALTGVMGAWVDGIPMIVISGNVRYETSIEASGLPLRYRGIQEFDIINSIQNMTKYSLVLKDPRSVRFEVEKAYKIAMSGRRGPVWIDIPLDIQNALVDTDDLYVEKWDYELPEVSLQQVEAISEALRSAKRPCILFGSAITTAHIFDEFDLFISEVKVPVVGGAWQGDGVALENDWYFGSSGNVGPRMGNFILENADVILVLGNSLSYKQTGYDIGSFAPSAKKIMVDIDENEMHKLGGMVDTFVHGSIESFFSVAQKIKWNITVSQDWITYCKKLKSTFSPYEGAKRALLTERVNKYLFWQRFNALAPDNVVTTLGNSQVGLAMNQVGKQKDTQRIIANYICGSMGYDLPASIGVAVAAKREVVCITGDGSFMMNLQELETIVHNHLPIKIVVFENNGYGGIRQSQSNYFGDFDFGSGPCSGVGFPDFEKIADAFNLPYRKCDSNAQIDDALNWLFACEGPIFLEVSEILDDPVVPKMISRIDENGAMTSPVLYDLSPFVDEDVMHWVMEPSRCESKTQK